LAATSGTLFGKGDLMKIQPLNGMVWLAIGLIFVCSCGGGKRTVKSNANSQILQDLTPGHFQQALDKCQFEYQKKPKDTVILNQYLEAIKQIKVSADKAFEREDFVLAGNTYNLLLRNFPRFPPFTRMLSFDVNYLTLRVRVSRTCTVEKHAQFHLKAGSVQEAIDLYHELYQQYPRDPVVQNNCTNLLELIKANADFAFEKNDLVLAGSTYRILFRNLGVFTFINHSISYNRELLNTNIEKCQRKLFENGLEQYRSGNLNTAISIWKSILTFDPENPEVKKAVDIAILQLRNLERKEGRDAQ
jgi:tetratricopeptide (TPR) repeat protein